MPKEVTWDWEPSVGEAKDVRDTKMLDVVARETRDEGPNKIEEDRTASSKPKGPFGMHK